MARPLRLEFPGSSPAIFCSTSINRIYGPRRRPPLRRVAEIIKKHRGSAVLVEGHTDSIGTESYNLRLSEQRAVAVKRWLVESGGIESTRIETKGSGASKPVV